VIRALLDHDIACDEPDFAIVEQQVNLAFEDHHVVKAARPVDRRMPRWRAANDVRTNAEIS